jgi:putative membrane protein
MRLDAAAAREIEAAFAAAQMRTRAPIVCVVARSSADYALAPTLGLVLAALALPWMLLAFTELSTERILLSQLVLVALGLSALHSTRLRAALAPPTHRRSACYRASVIQFAQRGLSHAREQNGTLLYVSLAERYARVVSGAGAEANGQAWRALIAELGDALRTGEPGAAFQSAAARMGEILAAHYPAFPGQEKSRGKHFFVL